MKLNGKRLCDFCRKPANGPQELDFTDPCGEPWGPDFKPIRYDFCPDCHPGGRQIIRTGQDRISL